MLISFDDLELDQVMSAAASLPPDQRDAFLQRIAGAVAHAEHCKEGGVTRAIPLAQQREPLTFP
jgi:DNA-directed RNA polymerase specialized sigma24 family protein